MSRCFPYPPPGYCKHGATNEALIESIKKETVKSVKDKSERKKEKREKKERKEKKREEKRNAKVKQAIQKNPTEFQPNPKEACFEKTTSKTVAEPGTEHLEKSDLTVELGEPTTSEKPSYSSDCTQNSNKRKRDDVSVPEGSSGLGKSIKIRLLKKHKPDSDRDVLCTNSGRSDTCLTGADAILNLVPSNRTAGVPTTSGRENIPAHGHLLSHTTSTPSFERHITKSNDLQGFAPSSARLPLTHLRHDTPCFNSNKTQDPVPSTSIAVPNNIVSTRNGNQNGNIITDIPQKSSLTRQEKKRQKKFSKYEKLIGSWVPPVLEAPQLLPVVDEDWLSRRGPEVASSSRDNVETSRELPQSSLWQPCARYLVETDIYALPYTVPF